MTSETFFDCTGIKPVRLADWLDTACHCDIGSKIPRIVLPMIQRGSVWKPHQVMDLWDTLLRGMPVGSMMASVVTSGQAINPLTRKLEDVSAESPALGLLDGQQRTLAMLLAWPTAPANIERRIWIEMGDKPPVDKLFRYHFTTKSQPFGFERAGPSGQPVAKLSRHNRREALKKFVKHPCELPTNFKERQEFLWKHSQPFQATVPIDLRDILKLREKPQALRDFVHKALAQHEGKDIEAQALKNLDRLVASLEHFETLHLPIINVPNQHFAIEEESPNGEVHDPALAVLFQRIGTGGTALSNADYVFSVIKHHKPECHSLVETALQDENIAALFAPVSLVTTAVRLTAAQPQVDARDYAKIEKQQFALLMKQPNFLDTFTQNIGDNGLFLKSLATLLNAIRYQAGKSDIGLPNHALCLIDVRVLEAMLLWVQRNGATAVDANRTRLIRFAIYWRLAVIDQDKADRKVFEFLKGNPSMPAFPDEELVRLLVDASLALPMVAPETYVDDKEILAKVIRCPEPLADRFLILRGWQRFDLPSLLGGNVVREEDRKRLEAAVLLYRRFANGTGPHRNYRHALLLWLQRAYMMDKFEETPALPGSDDETPYDFDHICPANHWSDWTGTIKKQVPDRIIDFTMEKSAEQWLGNSIGNVRVWDSSDNRSLSDVAPDKRLETVKDREDSIVNDDEGWEDCGSGYQWSRERAIAFQRAIEARTFNLYKKLYEDLDFAAYDDMAAGLGGVT